MTEWYSPTSPVAMGKALASSEKRAKDRELQDEIDALREARELLEKSAATKRGSLLGQLRAEVRAENLTKAQGAKTVPLIEKRTSTRSLAEHARARRLTELSDAIAEARTKLSGAPESVKSARATQLYDLIREKDELEKVLDTPAGRAAEVDRLEKVAQSHLASGDREGYLATRARAATIQKGS